MDKIWDRKSFEVGDYWPLWRGWKNQMTTQNRQSDAKNKTKQKQQTNKTCPSLYFMKCSTTWLDIELDILYTRNAYTNSCTSSSKFVSNQFFRQDGWLEESLYCGREWNVRRCHWERTRGNWHTIQMCIDRRYMTESIVNSND